MLRQQGKSADAAAMARAARADTRCARDEAQAEAEADVVAEAQEIVDAVAAVDAGAVDADDEVENGTGTTKKKKR